MAIKDGLKFKVKRIPLPFNDLIRRPDFSEVEAFLNSDEMEEFVYIVNIDRTNDKGQQFTDSVDIYYRTKA